MLRTAVPNVSALEGRRAEAVERLGKRVVLVFDGGLLLVVHLMIAGRLRWLAADAKPPGTLALAALVFDHGQLVLTEAGTTRRAALHVLADRAALAAMDPGGIDIFAADQAAFTARLKSENHTLKRALTDPRLFSGIGNAYSDEILHRARLSPVTLTRSLPDDAVQRLFDATRAVLVEWIDRPRAAAAARPDGWPDKVTAFHPGMAVHGRYKLPCPTAARRCCASSTPTTRPTTARAARPAASCSPTAPCRRC